MTTDPHTDIAITDAEVAEVDALKPLLREWFADLDTLAEVKARFGATLAAYERGKRR